MFDDLKQYFSLGVPGALMLCLDVYGNILVDIVSGWISVECQAAQVVLVNIICMVFMVGLGMEQSSCSLVGRQIGRNNISEAKQFYKAFLKFTTLIILLVVTVSYTYSFELIELHTDIV